MIEASVVSWAGGGFPMGVAVGVFVGWLLVSLGRWGSGK